MSPLRMVYLGLAAIGAVVPLYFCVLWFRANGFDPLAMIALWFSDDVARGIAWELVIAAIALFVWVLAEVRVRRNWVALWALPATFLVGPGFGLPLYLFLRTRPVA
ncbi:MAG: DUF2834 domain-containing protein [Halocynthiibacter sp.]